MQTTANDNYRPAAPGGGFHPEMGERHDGTALFVMQTGYKGRYLSWKPERHSEALAAFKANRIRPRYMQSYETTKGKIKWSCTVTWAAGDKLMKARLAVLEMLLD